MMAMPGSQGAQDISVATEGVSVWDTPLGVEHVNAGGILLANRI